MLHCAAVAVLPRPLLVSLSLLSVLIAVGTFGYMYIERWRFIEALWMVTITLTTIGFGEIHPLSDAGRVFTIVLIVSGVGIGSYGITTFAEALVSGKIQAFIRDRQRRSHMRSLRNHFIVVGYGRLGQAIADELHASGVPVAVVEKDTAKVAYAESHKRYPVVHGDGANDDTLREAGVELAKGIAVAVDSSAASIYVTLSARELNPRLVIVTRVDDTTEAQKARRAGASVTVSPHTMGGWRMAHELIRPHATSFMEALTLAQHESIQLEEFTVRLGSPADGATLVALNPPGAEDRVTVVGIRRVSGSLEAMPGPDATLGAGDVFIVIGTPAGVRRLRKAAGDAP